MVAQTPLLSEQIVRMSRARRWLQHPQGEPPWGIAQARSRPDFGDVSSGLPEKARTPKSFKYRKEINEFCLSGPSGTPLGALLGPLGGLLARLWTILGTSWAILGPSGPSWGALRGLLRPPGAFGGVLGPSGAVLGPPGAPVNQPDPTRPESYHICFLCI